MKDSTKTIEIPFTFDNKGNKGLFVGTTTLQYGDYGISDESKSGNDKVVLNIEVPVFK